MVSAIGWVAITEGAGARLVFRRWSPSISWCWLVKRLPRSGRFEEAQRHATDGARMVVPASGVAVLVETRAAAFTRPNGIFLGNRMLSARRQGLYFQFLTGGIAMRKADRLPLFWLALAVILTAVAVFLTFSC